MILEKKFLVEGEHLVLEAYKSNLLEEVILCNNEIDLDIEKVYVSENVMKVLSDLSSKVGIIGVCKIVDNNIDYNSLNNKIKGEDRNPSVTFRMIARWSRK